MDKKRLTALVLLDLSKAFDSIDHLKLRHKLWMVGASPAVVNWFKSYLCDRSQSTRRASTLSDPLPITHGVLYPKVLYSRHCCFASIWTIYRLHPKHAVWSHVDDTKVFLSFPLSDIDSAVWKLEDDLRNVARWWCDKTLITTYSLTRTRPNSVLSEPGSWSVDHLPLLLWPFLASL